MFTSNLKKNSPSIFILLLMVMTSCSSPICDCEKTIEIPCDWQTPIACGLNTEDPSCFLWWEAFNDPVLTTLIEDASCRNKDVRLAILDSREAVLKTVNDVTIEVGKSYIELRGLQMRSKILDANIQAQNEIFTINEGLTDRGFVSQIEDNEDKRNLNALLVQKSLTDLSIKKAIFHLSTLLAYTPGALNELLCQPENLPELYGEIPVGLPCDLICHSPMVQELRKAYRTTNSAEVLYPYQKAILNAFESAESALAAFQHEQDKIHLLQASLRLKSESYQLTKDLYNQGFKDDRDLLIAQQELFSAEDTLIQSKVNLLQSYLDIYSVVSSPWRL